MTNSFFAATTTAFAERKRDMNSNGPSPSPTALLSANFHSVARRRVFGFAALVLCFFFASDRLQAAAELDAARIHQMASFLPERPIGVGQPITNRVEWTALAELPAFKGWLAGSRDALLRPLPEVSDELFLEFSRNGNRSHWQGIEFERRARMTQLALAECLEDKGVFVGALEKAIHQICAERTWVYPAHDRSLSNFYGKTINIELGSSALAWELATINFLLAERLSPSTRALIRTNLQERIFQPYRDMVEGRRKEDNWLRTVNNWNAVCLAGVTGAALATLDSKQDRAWFIASAEFYSRNFLRGFTPDGYCSEGLGYWNYGFGNFIMLGETIRQSTAGKVDFLADPAVRNPALFDRRIEIIHRIYPSIADCHPGSMPDPALTTYLCRRFNLVPCDSGNDVFRHPSNSLFTTVLFSFLPAELPRVKNETRVESPLRSWFPEGGVLICRPEQNAKIPFAVSLKGGHNGEQHNHNDLGSYIVVAGSSVVVADPGAEIYTGRTFSSRRYESDVLNSFGHDVPVVAGKWQTAGTNSRARVLDHRFSDDQDTLTLDLKSAYAVPGLKRLERTFVYQRGAPSLSVRDDVEFTNPQSFETALVTWGEWKQVGTNEFTITESGGAVRVVVESGGRPFAVSQKQLEADVPTAKKALRIGLTLKEPVTQARVVLTITPQAAARP